MTDLVSIPMYPAKIPPNKSLGHMATIYLLLRAEI